MIYGLGWTNWLRLIVWLMIGFVFYFRYGKSHSRINAPPPEMPEGIILISVLPNPHVGTAIGW
jgi:hypothetical protein